MELRSHRKSNYPVRRPIPVYSTLPTSFNPMPSLQQQLDVARENARVLKESHQAVLQKVANSPTKSASGHKPAGPAVRGGGKGRQSVVISVSKTSDTANKSRIPAYRPPSGDPEADADDAEADAEGIVSDEAADLSPRDFQGDHQVEQDVPRYHATPLFLTKKKKVMHCELDEPGLVAYPKNHMKKGFFQRLFGCFHRPSVYSPVRVTSHRPRPPSSGMVPAMLALENEVAPLRASLHADEGFGGLLKDKETAMGQSVLSGSLEGMHHDAVTIDDEPREAREVAAGLVMVSQAPVSAPVPVPVQEGGNVTKADVYSGRLLRQQRASSVANVTRLPEAPMPASTTAATTRASPTKTSHSPVRMTKAQRLREQANMRKIEERHVAESAHYQALPRSVRKTVAPPEAGRRASVLLPQLRESLNASASAFDEAKRASIETAAAKVLEESETPLLGPTLAGNGGNDGNDDDYNPLLSMSFSDDPFYRELAKIDHSLTDDDLAKLRTVLASSEFRGAPFKA